MEEGKPVKIIADHAEEQLERVGFGFKSYITTLGRLIANRENETPLVIGIYGQWGSGKTTLMRNIQAYLKKKKNFPGGHYRRCKSVWFQPWKYDKEEEILAALIEEIFRTMRRNDFFQACKGKIEKLAQGVNKIKITGAVTKLLTGIDVSEFFDELPYKGKIGFYDIFQDFFDDLVWTYLNWRGKKSPSEKPDDRKAALVIFIDDLDRCPRERIKKVLETVKLFMDRQGCIFVIGASRDIVKKALEKDYGADAEYFMEKMVQVTFNLPYIPEGEFKAFVAKRRKDIPAEFAAHLPLILPAMRHNPRRLKRFINDMNLQHGLLKNSQIDIDYKLVLLWSIIGYSYPSLMRDIVETRGAFLFDFQARLRKSGIVKTLAAPKRWEPTEEILTTFPAPLREYVNDRNLIKVVTEFECKDEQLLELMTIREAVRSPEPPAKEDDLKAHRSIGTLVRVPAGKFIYGDPGKESEIEKDYEIGVYPVTHREYTEFIHGGGYQNNECWSEGGVKWRDENRITLPQYWDDERFNDPEQPVVGVSWYEAAAYCQWLSLKTGNTFHLPTEEEWEKAARGTDGLQYPWGNEWDPRKCNSKESGIGKTTRVTLYLGGVSPCGCFDMAGNVWEWCDSLNCKCDADCFFRGGSWNDNSSVCRSFRRSNGHPSRRRLGIGFRLAKSL